ncbi:UNVERIFIED_CONTAM: hypothetical protein Sangu_2360900 [Sesamum angustifolium]|uniref:Alpha 1,4-glycosyltransferase domain-containing protein n=1 Tax=Sesamum angustifolium TaxID=2727405 RepID=A0AAW2KVK6_9LAMI
MEEFDTFLSQFLFHLQRSKRSFYALISLLLLCLIAYNSATIFCTHVPISAEVPPGPSSFSPENVPGNSRKFFSVNSSAKLSSAVLFSVKGESSGAKLKTHLPLLHKNRNLVVRTTVHHSKRRDRNAKVKQFEDRVIEFFNPNSSDSSCLVQPVNARKCKSWGGPFRPEPLKFTQIGLAVQVWWDLYRHRYHSFEEFRGLKNAIGAQTIDLDTGKWSRVTGRPGYNFTVLPPMAFYPVDWSKIGSLFQGPQSLNHSKWLLAKLRQIRSQSFAVHLWNKQSRGFEVQKGSVIQHIMFSSGAFHNSSTVGTE